jgi:hypothetical protein
MLGSTWFALGMSAALLLFGRDAGGTAEVVTSVADAQRVLGGIEEELDE